MQELQVKAKQVAQQVPYLRMLILFGSRARGDTHAKSDWDFAVLYDEALRNQSVSGYGWLEIYEALSDCFQISQDKIDVVEINTCSPTIAHYIARDGKLLYEQSTGLFEEFKRKALMSEEELKALRKRLREKLESSLQRRRL